MFFKKHSSKKEIFCEYINDVEKTATEAVAKSVIARMESVYEGRRALRDTHVKTHACVDANLEIFDFDEQEIKSILIEKFNISPKQLNSVNIKQGILKVPRSFPAILRFANGTTRAQSDKALDARSMSVKLYDVIGDHLKEAYSTKEQDIIVQNASVFFVRGIADYHSFFKAARGKGWRILPWLLFHPYQAVSLYKTIRRKPISLMTETYWSGSAYALGDVIDSLNSGTKQKMRYPLVVKYGFFPTSPNAPFEKLEPVIRPKQVSDNYYRDDIIQRLTPKKSHYYWDFSIQIQTHPKHSVDDVTIEWPETEAPFFRVGRLSVSSQLILPKDQFETGESMRFSPWNGLKVHRPVGELNRLRGNIYPIVANIRQNR